MPAWLFRGESAFAASPAENLICDAAAVARACVHLVRKTKRPSEMTLIGHDNIAPTSSW
jgi:hypothetical protein